MEKQLEKSDWGALMAIISSTLPLEMFYGAWFKLSFKGLDEIKEFTRMEETTTRPYNQVLLDLYSGGEALGFGIGHSSLK